MRHLYVLVVQLCMTSRSLVYTALPVKKKKIEIILERGAALTVKQIEISSLSLLKRNSSGYRGGRCYEHS